MRVRPWTLNWAATAAFAVGFGALSVLQHRAFWTGRFDLGNLTQAVWSTAHGDILQMTDLQGRQISRLGAHFDPLVAMFAPLWWLWPNPSLLLVVQAAGVALGAPAVFLLARRHDLSEVTALGTALAYLLHPATQWLVLADFHPVAFATPLLLWAVWFLDQGRLMPFAALAGAACLTKEQIGLVVAALGLWYALRDGRRRAGAVIALAGVAVSLVAIAVVIPHYAPGGSSPFAGRYAEVGGSPGGILRTAVTDPAAIAGAATESRDGGFLLSLLAPLGFLPLLAPLAALTAVPELALDLLSSTRTQTSIHFHYTAGAIPGLMLATVIGLARLRRWRPATIPWVARGLVAVVVVSGAVLGPLPTWRFVPGGAELGAREHLPGRHAEAARRVLAQVPSNQPVSATNTLGAHLSARARVFSFPVRAEARWVVIDTTRPSYLDRAHAPEPFAAALEQLERDRRFALIAREDGVVLYRRR